MTKSVRKSVTSKYWGKNQQIGNYEKFYFGSIGESGPGDCNKIFDSIARVRRLTGAAGLRTFRLDSTTTSSATIAKRIKEIL